jgi:pimeloyl-ACP methyl ester carboxylesterase
VSRAALPSSALGLPPTTRRRSARGPIAVIDVAASQPAEVDENRPVVLVPGFTGSKEDFGPLLRRLAARGHRAVALDLPGQYESDGPATPAEYSIEALGEDVLGVVDGIAEESGGPVHIVGHSFGGLVVRAAAIARPDAFASVVLLDSGPAMIPTTRETAIRLLVEAATAQDLTLDMIWDAIISFYAAEGASAPPAEAAAFQRARFTRTSRESLIGMGRALLTSPDRTDELAATGVATFVLFGENDDAWPPSLQTEMAERLGAEVGVVADAAHSPAIENTPGTAAALLGWLGAHEPACGPSRR